MTNLLSERGISLTSQEKSCIVDIDYDASRYADQLSNEDDDDESDDEDADEDDDDDESNEDSDENEDDDYACEVCGSALDSDHLLLCDTEGCDMAYHTSCLRAPSPPCPRASGSASAARRGAPPAVNSPSRTRSRRARRRGPRSS